MSRVEVIKRPAESNHGRAGRARIEVYPRRMLVEGVTGDHGGRARRARGTLGEVLVVLLSVGQREPLSTQLTFYYDNMGSLLSDLGAFTKERYLDVQHDPLSGPLCGGQTRVHASEEALKPVPMRFGAAFQVEIQLVIVFRR